MNRVLDRLWLGSTKDVLASSTLKALGFVAVLDLRDRVNPGEDSDSLLQSKRLNNPDGMPWSENEINGALDFIYKHIQNGRVLVVCVAGMSRSASVIIGYLVRCGWDTPTAFETVREARSIISPSPGMLESVLKVADKVAD
jgi:protein-tyrosine phosphatase